MLDLVKREVPSSALASPIHQTLRAHLKRGVLIGLIEWMASGMFASKLKSNLGRSYHIGA